MTEGNPMRKRRGKLPRSLAHRVAKRVGHPEGSEPCSRSLKPRAAGAAKGVIVTAR